LVCGWSTALACLAGGIWSAKADSPTLWKNWVNSSFDETFRCGTSLCSLPCPEVGFVGPVSESIQEVRSIRRAAKPFGNGNRGLWRRKPSDVF
jgi:hypothetical protein